MVFDIIVTLTAGEDSVRLRIADYHTNIVLIEKNGETLLEAGTVVSQDAAGGLTDRSCMSVEAIVDFVNTCDIEDVREIVQRQIDTLEYGGHEKPLGSQHRQGPPGALRRRHQDSRPGHGRRRVRRPDERL